MSWYFRDGYPIETSETTEEFRTRVEEVTRSYHADPVARKVIGILWTDAINGMRVRLGLDPIKD